MAVPLRLGAKDGERKRESHFRFNRRRTRIGIRDLEHQKNRSAERKRHNFGGEAHAIILLRALCRDAGAHSLGEIIYQRRERQPDPQRRRRHRFEKERAHPPGPLTHKDPLRAAKLTPSRRFEQRASLYVRAFGRERSARKHTGEIKSGQKFDKRTSEIDFACCETRV